MRPDAEGKDTVSVHVEDAMAMEAQIRERIRANEVEAAALKALLDACRSLRGAPKRRPKVEPITSPTGRKSKCAELANRKR